MYGIHALFCQWKWHYVIHKTRQTVSIPYYTILYYTILYHTIPYHTIPYYTMLYYTIPYYTITQYTILYYNILYFSDDRATRGRNQGLLRLGITYNLRLGYLPEP